MTKFVVLTTQRSGATFFIECLSSHPQILCHHETLFSQRNRLKFLSFDQPHAFYYRYRSGSLKHQLEHLTRSKRLIYNCIDDYLSTLAGKAEVIGLKVSYNQIAKYPAIAHWINEREVRIIHLVRENVLKTHLSLMTAKKRKLSHSTRKVVPVQVWLDPRKVQRVLRRRLLLVEEHRAMFTDKPYLEVCYEAFVVDRESESRRVLRFLDIDEFVPLQASLVKLNPDSLEQIIENYDQVAQALRGTELERYLEM